MRYLLWLLTSFRGRISRKTWWLGSIAWLVAFVAATVVVDPTLFTSESDGLTPPTLTETILSAVFLVPALALVIKRLNDRDQPRWVGYTWGGTSLAFLFASHFGLISGDPLEFANALWALIIGMNLFELWIVIDNGFLKGTRGPNRYGDDPLAEIGTAEPNDGPRRMRFGRTVGANFRDGLVGALAAIAALYLALPGLSYERTMHWALGDLLEIPDLLVKLEMHANKPAWQAFTEGQAAAEGGDHARAVELFSRAIEIYGPGEAISAEVFAQRGYALRELERLQEALASFNAAISLDPDGAHYLSGRAQTFWALGRYADALSDFDAALRTYPDNGDYHIGRGYSLKKLNRTNEAIAAFTTAIEAAEEEFEDAKLFEERNPSEASKSAIEESRANRDRVMTSAYVQRGNSYRDSGQFEPALGDYNEALRIQPDDVLALRNRGQLHEQRGDLDAARADYEKAANLEEPDGWLRQALDRVK